MDQPLITMKDANGQYVCIKNEDLNKAIMQHDFTLFGLSLRDIRRLKQRHVCRGGTIPVTYDGNMPQVLSEVGG